MRCSGAIRLRFANVSMDLANDFVYCALFLNSTNMPFTAGQLSGKQPLYDYDTWELLGNIVGANSSRMG